MRSVVLGCVCVLALCASEGCAKPASHPAAVKQPGSHQDAKPLDAGPQVQPTSGPDAQATVQPKGPWTTAGGRKSLGATPLPCELHDVLATSCQGCHSADPGLIAPMALVTFEDLTAPAVSDPSLKVYELAERRIHTAGSPMPPASSRRLTSDELATLDASFVGTGPVPGPRSCATDSGVPPVELPDATVNDATVGSDDIGACYRFQAHDQPVAGDTTPFQLPNGERYACFYFAVPWPDDSQAVALRSLDSPFTHHWQLYHVVESYTDGQITRQATDCGFTLRDVLGVYSHSQEHEQRMPDGVGLELPPQTSAHGLLLEVHYYNPGDTVGDSTGVEVCTAKTPRPHSATIAVLGASSFTIPAGQKLDVDGTCTPQTSDEISVFRSYPHMHARGVGMQAMIERAQGGSDMLFDVPFDFNNQKMYDTPATIHPGDRVRSTCHFLNDTDHDISAGFSANEEMCNNFVYYWPAGALSFGVVNGVSTVCLF